MKQTKVSKALAYLKAHPGSTAYAAAKHAHMPASPLYAYLKRQRAKESGVCPTCGQPEISWARLNKSKP